MTEYEVCQQNTMACEQEIAKGIIGQKDVIRQVMLALLAGGNVLLEGMPGLGKTMLVRTISQVCDLSFQRIQFTPDLMPSDVTGTNIIVKEEQKSAFRFEKGPIFANLVLADEINRTSPKTQAALLDTVSSLRGHAGTHRDDRNDQPSAAGAVSGACHTKSDRKRGNLSAAGSPAGSFFV